jgi:NTE family protein
MAKLKVTDICYIAMEGGGGKGIAFLGALQVLEGINVLANVRGYAGASAGAITAFLLSMNYKVKDIETFLNRTNFDAFWEQPDPRALPAIGAAFTGQPTSGPEELIAKALEQVRNSLHAKALWTLLVTAWPPLGAAFAKQPAAALASYWPRMVAYIFRDMGLFPGRAPRDVFEQEIQRAMGTSSGQFVTFAEHAKRFDKLPVLTGTNLSTGLTEVFSATTTPSFPVSDAVRISMGLPFIFKPYVISKKSAGGPPCGTYVDGGLWNNLPFREFEGEGLGALLTPKNAPGPMAVQNTLLLRLEVNAGKKVKNLWTMLKATLPGGLFGSGESQVNQRYADQVILLDTEGLELVEFTPPVAVRETVVKRARRASLRYFHLEVPAADANRADDEASATRRTAAAQVCD